MQTEANINAAGCNFNSYIRRAVRFIGGNKNTRAFYADFQSENTSNINIMYSLGGEKMN